MRLIIILLCCIYTQFLISQTYTNNSVLSEGQMYKIEVKETGIYKITGNQLSDAGIDLSTINGSNLQLFGNGGKPLEELIASERYDDLVENAIKVSTDGSLVLVTTFSFMVKGQILMMYLVIKNYFLKRTFIRKAIITF